MYITIVLKEIIREGGGEAARASRDAQGPVLPSAEIQAISTDVTTGAQSVNENLTDIDRFFDKISFVDKSVTPETVFYDYASGIKKRMHRGVVPFDVDDTHLEILRNAECESTDNRRHKVVGFSLGGTNVDLAAAEISIDGSVDSKAFDSKKIDVARYESANDFWNGMFPNNFREVLKTGVDDNGELFVGVTIAHPVEDGVLREGKFNCPELTNGSVKIEDSLKKFIGDLGIVDEKNIHISVSPNDTRSTLLANFKNFRELGDKHIGSFVLGTGVNASLGGRVTEMGDYLGFNPSDLDINCSLSGVLSMDSLVAGQDLGYKFIYAVLSLFPKNSETAFAIFKLNDDEVKKLIFDLVYGTADLGEGISAEEINRLKCIAKKFVSRIVRYVSIMLIGFAKEIKEDVVLFVDGSLVTENPQLLEELNQAMEPKVKLVMPDLDVRGEFADEIKGDASLVGTMVMAMVEKLKLGNF